MIRLLIALTCCAAFAVGCTISREKQAEIKDAAGTVGTFLGLPRPVGEGVATLVLAGIAAVGGHKNGRRVERNAQQDPVPLCGPMPDPQCGSVNPSAPAPVANVKGPTGG